MENRKVRWYEKWQICEQSESRMVARFKNEIMVIEHTILWCRHGMKLFTIISYTYVSEKERKFGCNMQMWRMNMRFRKHGMAKMNKAMKYSVLLQQEISFHMKNHNAKQPSFEKDQPRCSRKHKQKTHKLVLFLKSTSTKLQKNTKTYMYIAVEKLE